MPSPFALLHVDTGHNFSETLDFRDAFARDHGYRLVVRLVQDSIDAGTATDEKGTRASRNAIQSITLMEAIRDMKIDCAVGGARRDEEKSRAKERFFSHRDSSGKWEPRRQRPEVWRHFNGSKAAGDHFRVFPLNNWTEYDVWSYICAHDVPVPSLYFSHEREVFERDGVLYSVSPYLQMEPGEVAVKERIRFRTVGDATCTGAIRSTASTLSEVLEEVRHLDVSERAGRADDLRSEAAMEDRKCQGYF
jgi:sulfate adenylyltransferase subunit 2